MANVVLELVFYIFCHDTGVVCAGIKIYVFLSSSRSKRSRSMETHCCQFNLNLHLNRFTLTLVWSFKLKSRTKSIFNIISSTQMLLIWFSIVLWINYIWLMIFNNQIKNRNLKLCDSNGPSWPIGAMLFCRTRIRLKNPSFSYSYQLRPHSLIKIQDTKFR